MISDAIRKVEARLGNRVMGFGVYKRLCCECGQNQGELVERFDGVCAHLECLMKRDL